jgi:hypothetical protein
MSSRPAIKRSSRITPTDIIKENEKRQDETANVGSKADHIKEREDTNNENGL